MSGEVEEDNVDLGPLAALYAFPEPMRSRYCSEVIESLAVAIGKITAMKSKLAQGRAVKLFLKDLRTKRDEIMPVFLYIVKPEFRDQMLEFIDKLSGIDN